MYPTYNSLSVPSSEMVTISDGLAIWIFIAFILALIGGVLTYFLFVKKKNSYKGFTAWLHDFLNFKTLFIEAIMKIAYCFAVIFITLFSFGLISMPGVGFLAFLLTLILGNLGARVAYEFMMLTLILVRNTTDISRKLGADKGKKEEK